LHLVRRDPQGRHALAQVSFLDVLGRGDLEHHPHEAFQEVGQVGFFSLTHLGSFGVPLASRPVAQRVDRDAQRLRRLLKVPAIRRQRRQR